ncbi:protein FAR1-RELATED SEQUENCE 5-like [Phalaenopsis equestris]|uniref:protein FAR1-RELATED SEQUENCE 5-like n=1 Tax=Phalaenopsis equestris TaxID=78828 RepID=UPI0009E3E78B|nr:protein FAR1-RELATED SEQUENCE 5-like [Phalaenopsis equestris]
MVFKQLGLLFHCSLVIFSCSRSFELFDLLTLKMEYDYRECRFMFDAFGESNGSCTEQRRNIFLETLVHNEKEAYEVYCAYAHQIGFSVHKDHATFWTNSKNIKTNNFVCGKTGFKKKLKITETVKYRKAETRTGCSAMIRYGVDEEGNWTVKKLIELHNHSLANPGDKHLLCSNRKISEVNADVLRSMTQSEMRPKDVFNFLAQEVEGVENLECTKTDAFNFIQRERRCRIENDDENTDEFFWSDGTSRLDYDCFGDVIIFDMSYRLNKYNLCCAPIISVNHNCQNVLFGVGFLSEETTDSFKWLFKTFICIMGDNHPITIYTDQDQAMATAISEILPNTRHRLCQWHIYKKLPTKIHCGVRNRIVSNLFYKCLSKCESEEELDDTYRMMIEIGNLQDNIWLDDMYKIRQKWSTAFNEDVFGMRILSAQRSESTNNICHGVSKPTSSITDCFLGIENVMRTWKRNEKDEDFKCDQYMITLVAKSSPILRQAAAFYSRKLYTMFEEEFIHESCDDHMFNTTWVVHFDSSSLDRKCSYRKFEMMGMLCSHALRVLNFLHIKKIHVKYLLLRWSENAKKYVYNSSGYMHLQQSQFSHDIKGDLIFQAHMQKAAYQCTQKAKGNPEVEQRMRESMKKLSLDIDDILVGKNSRDRSE